MANIAATAVVDRTAELGEDVTIGPGCVIEPGVTVGDGSVLKTNVMVCSGAKIGRNNRIFANCVLGDEPQSIGIGREDTQLIIGDNNTIRENVTINRGTVNGGGKTVIGSNCYLMIGSHAGHDCRIEDNVVLCNNVLLSGHCRIERNAWLSGLAATHQFVTVGRYAFLAGGSGASHDVPPFVRVSGIYPCEVRGLNVIGLGRAGFGEEDIRNLDKCYRRLYRRRGGESLARVVETLLADGDLDENVEYLLKFLQRSNEHPMNRFLELFRGH